MADESQLTPEQSQALFDVLTHRETYREIEDFKYPGAIHQYGPPFQDHVSSSQSPILQSLLAKFILQLPGLRDVSPQFWKVQVENLIQDLAEADLSESYDKGAVGIRKTLATAIAALIEYPARGSLGGFPKRDVDTSRDYDTKNPEDVQQAWRDGIQRAVYGDLIDVEFKKMAETRDLSDHMPLIQAMHEFILVNLASIMHYTFVLSPEGPTLIHMIDNVNKLIPYMMIRQTLKIGNVATMISGMMRVVLAKVSVASVTNWIGLSSGADEGMNLMQQIINQVLGWDKRDLKHRAHKIEHDKNGPPKAVREELNAWIGRSREEHQKARRQSKTQQISIVTAILQTSAVSTKLTEIEHAKALEYLALNLSVRDRTEIIRVLCKRNPDLLTAATKAAVDTYTPLIRQIHQAANLADSFWDLEQFISDMLKVAKPHGTKEHKNPPSVEDFVDLLHRHAHALHKFLHQVAKNGEELTGWFLEWAKHAAAQFRSHESPPSSASLVSEKLVTGGIEKEMAAAFLSLSASDQTTIKEELTAHREYLDDLHKASTARISAVIRRTHKTPFGPGAYLARWQQHMDDTAITPATAKGSLRHGSNRSVKGESMKHSDGQDASIASADQVQKAVDSMPVMPKSEVTVTLLGPKFRQVLGGS